MPDDDSRGEGSFGRFVLRRTVLVLAVVFICTSLVFGYVHFGPNPPVEETGTDGEQFQEKKSDFGLYRPLPVQYVDYLTEMATLDFGEVWSSRYVTESIQKGPDDVNDLVAERSARTLWLWAWTLVVALLVGIPLGVVSAIRTIGDVPTSNSTPPATASSQGGLLRGVLLRAAPVAVLAPLLEHVLLRSPSVLFGWNWLEFGVETVRVSGPLHLDDLAVATKLAIPPAVALAIPFVGTVAAVSRRAMVGARAAGHVEAARGAGLSRFRLFRRHVLRNAVLPVATTLRRTAAALVGATVVVEILFSLEGAGQLFYNGVTHSDFTTLQATLFLLFCFLGAVALLQDVLVAWLGGARTGRERRARACWTATETAPDRDATDAATRGAGREKLRVRQPTRNDGSLGERVRQTPLPFAVWLLAGGVLLALEAGALLDVAESVLSIQTPELPTLLSREHVPNQGYNPPNEGWQGTAFGLSPALALALRAGLVLAYAFAWVAWAALGWRIYRSVYRLADRTPTDDAIRRFLARREVLVAGLVVATVFVSALFAPTLVATPIDRTEVHADLQQMPITKPNDSAQLTYYDEERETVTTTSVGLANMYSKADGTDSNVAPLSYDDYGRFHPLGTSKRGTDLYSEMVVGTRVYAFVGGLGAAIVATLAMGFALVASRVRGRVETGLEGLANVVAGLPVLVVAFALLETFDRIVVHDATTTLVLMAVLFGALGWADLWQTLRTPAYRALDGHWRDRCQLVGRPAIGAGRGLSRLAGIVLAYATTAFAGIVLTLTGFAPLSGTIWTTTRTWGEFYVSGIQVLTSASGHTAVVPGIAIVVLIASALVLADGIRTATATGRELGASAPGEASALGGGG